MLKEKDQYMKLSVARSELLDALSVAGKGMSARSTLPILSGILVSASDGEMQLQATDLEMSVQTDMPRARRGRGTESWFLASC